MPVRRGNARFQVFQHQADATLSQANPVSTTLYEVLAITKNVRVISMAAIVTWTVQPSPLDIVVTIDGQTLTFTLANPSSAGWKLAFKQQHQPPTAQVLISASGGEVDDRKAFLGIEGRSVRIQARTTGGTVSSLEARVQYARIP